MHELNLCVEILRLIESQATKQACQRVTAVWLEIGQLAGVEQDAMAFSFPIATKDSIAAHARLHIITIPGKAWCQFCQKAVMIEKRFSSCPTCGQHQFNVIDGDQLRLQKMEVI